MFEAPTAPVLKLGMFQGDFVLLAMFLRRRPCGGSGDRYKREQEPRRRSLEVLTENSGPWRVDHAREKRRRHSLEQNDIFQQLFFR